MKLFNIIFVLCLLSVTSWSADQKIGVVNMSKVLFHYDEVKILRIQISNQEARYQAELNQQEKEAEELNMTMKDTNLSEQQRLEMEKEFSRRLFNLQRKFEEYKNKIEEQQEKELEKIHGKVLQEIKLLAAQKRLDLVLEERNVFFGKTEDLTMELIEKLNNQGSSNPQSNMPQSNVPQRPSPTLTPGTAPSNPSNLPANRIPRNR